MSRLYSVNGLNQYLSAGPASFSYDSNGNLTSDGSVNYGFDAENRLISASGARSAALVYDPLGRLHSTSGGSAGETRLLYDGDELIAEYDGAGTLLRRYVHGPLADDPMVWYEGASVAAAARRQMFTDHQGSVVAVADSVGALLRANSYDDWGTPGATNLGRFGYTGQAWIPEIGLFHYKARAYSPTLGRFLQTDPVGYDDQVNLYAYVANDPVNGRDPSGTYTCSGSKDDCTALRTALARAKEALKSDNLTKSEKSRIASVLKAYGTEGHRNNIGITFLDKKEMATQSARGAAFAKFMPNGTSVVALPKGFSTYGNSFVSDMKITMNGGPSLSKYSAVDERANIVVHEGDHAMRQQMFDRELNRSEAHPNGYISGELVNKAFGSYSQRQIDAEDD